MNDRGSCLECRHLRMSHDISGWEAHCTVNSRKGRKITWQYGMDMDWCKRCVEESLKKAPAWCPVKTEKLEPCPICGKEVEIKWVCGMDKKTAAAVRHPLNGKAGWYMEICPGRIMYEEAPEGTYNSQMNARKRLVRNWNMIAKWLCRKEDENVSGVDSGL